MSDDSVRFDMEIVVRLFAGHRERVGRDRIVVTVADGASAQDVFVALAELFPDLAPTRPFTKFARNRQMIESETLLSNGDELALLQPVSGGATGEVSVLITPEPLSVDRCIRGVEAPDCGGFVVFLGTVRNNSEGKATDYLEYEAYSEMATEAIQTIGHEAFEHWGVAHICVEHRTGKLQIGDVSVIVAVSSAHRAEAFDACRYVIDELKTRAPIWKKEFGEGGETWVGGPTA